MTETVNTREFILDILLDITKNGQYSHTAIANVLDKYQYLDKKDRSFIKRIVQGTLENQIQLDYIIGQFSKVPVCKMKPVIRCIIRSAVYQIFYMESVPDAAACNEAVRLAKKRGFRSLGGFVNGVLRNISRSRDQNNLGIVWPDREKEPERYLSVRYSVPEWMIRMWKDEFSLRWESDSDFQKMEHLLQAFLTPAPVTVRTDTSRCTPEKLKRMFEDKGVKVCMSAELPYAMQISDYDSIKFLPGYQEGLFYIQDISSMLAAEAAHPKEGDFVLDVCAAPGGKAIQLAQMMNGTGQVLARDLTEHKVNLLRENMQRCQVKNMEVQVWDARNFDQSLAEKADIVVADLPCSGLGVMRRKKDIRYHMTPDKIKELANLQREILSVACRYVKPGGRMVYSTCTISRQENEENVQWFLNGYEDFELVESRQILPAETGSDGFYIAQFRKKRKGNPLERN